ncbi:hypothetical protein ANN_21170 [Periplaneta americana]|uniref:Peptidase S1 domain-containing protein n=1 Tax=Periplaneta americana TaxID=6978 RepID=A0ABQ8SFW4_PERAM|nr:hypothetical protein ANN_21170 [Periplaneta americana]
MKVLVLLAALVACVAGVPYILQKPLPDGRIVGGTTTTITNFPYQLSLRYSGSHICGASIISANWAVTAGHCIIGSASSLTLRAGSTYSNTGGTVHQVSQAIRHGSYNANTLDYDIAVLKNTELHALYSSPDIIRNIKSRRLRWAGHAGRMGESRSGYRVLVARSEGKRPLGRPRRRWEDNKMDLREMGYDGRDWINLAQDRDQWRAYVRAAMNLRVSSAFSFGSSVQAIPLETGSVSAGTSAVVSGWGTTSEGGSASTTLRQVAVPIVSDSSCNSAYSSYGGITARMICAGYTSGGKDACQGDSGGPLVANGKLIGIVSWGAGCARPNYPGVYTKVSALRSWISSNTGV